MSVMGKNESVSRELRAKTKRIAALETEVAELKQSLERSREIRMQQVDMLEKQEQQLVESAARLEEGQAQVTLVAEMAEDRVRLARKELEGERSLRESYQALRKAVHDADDKTRERHRDEIEKRRAAIETLLRMVGQIHETAVQARFDDTPAAFTTALGKMRELIQSGVTREMLGLVDAPASWASNPAVLAMVGILGMSGLVWSLLGAYGSASRGAAGQTPPAVPAPPAAAAVE